MSTGGKRVRADLLSQASDGPTNWAGPSPFTQQMGEGPNLERNEFVTGSRVPFRIHPFIFKNHSNHPYLLNVYLGTKIFK